MEPAPATSDDLRLPSSRAFKDKTCASMEALQHKGLGFDACIGVLVRCANLGSTDVGRNVVIAHSSFLPTIG